MSNIQTTARHLFAARDWPVTSGWAEIMAVAYATHALLIGVANGVIGLGAGAFPAAETITLAGAIFAGIAVSVAVRLGSKMAFILGIALLVLPLVDFVQRLSSVADTGPSAIISATAPAFFALIAIGCLTSHSNRVWMILRRGALSSTQETIPNNQIAKFGAVAQYGHSLQVYADEEQISLIDVNINKDGKSEFANIIFVPRGQQHQLIQGLRDVLQYDDLPAEDFDAALIEVLRKAFTEKGLGLGDIPALAVKHKFSFKAARKELSTPVDVGGDNRGAQYH